MHNEPGQPLRATNRLERVNFHGEAKASLTARFFWKRGGYKVEDGEPVIVIEHLLAQDLYQERHTLQQMLIKERSGL